MRRAALLGLLAVALGTFAVRAAGPTAADCAACHAGSERPVTAEALKGSAHEALSCTDCHGDIKSLPHADKPGKADCSPCHGKESGDYKASPHALKAGGATCASCHGSHQIQRVKDSGGIGSGSRQMEVCGACHAKRPGPKGGTGQAWVMDYEKSVHGQAVLKMGLNIAPSCASCHGAHALRVLKTDDAPHKLQVADLCGTCHTQAHDAFAGGIHAQALQEGIAAAPTCTDCHGEHTIQGPKGPDSPVAPLAVPATCGKCHADKATIANFGLPSDRVSTFMQSYHGIALASGDLKAANCASCHGNHDVKLSSDPSSRTNPKNLDKTCGTCHPKAGKGFATVKIHVTVSPTGERGAWMVRVFYIGFIGVLILGFLLHIAAESFAKIKGRKTIR